MKNFFNLKLFLHLFVLFLLRKMKSLYTFFTLAIKQNLSGLNCKILCFPGNKQNFEIIYILYLCIICLNSGIQ